MHKIRPKSMETREIRTTRIFFLATSQRKTLVIHRIFNTPCLSVSDHANNILGSCSSSIDALRTLQARGMTGQTLHDVTRATMIGRLMYASPSWWGFLSERPESFGKFCATR